MAYTDMTSVFTYGRRILADDYTNLANNAAYEYDQMNHYRVQVHGPAQSFSAATETLMTFDTVDSDVYSIWNAAQNRFQFPAAGYYEVCAGLVLDSTTIAVTNQYRLRIRVFGGGTLMDEDSRVSRANSLELALNVNAVFHVTSPGSVFYAAYFFSSEAVDCLGGSDKKWMTARRLVQA